jgi:hypothetical protein
MGVTEIGTVRDGKGRPTKQHDTTSSANEFMGQIRQGNPRRGYAMYQQDLVSFLRAPFVDSDGPIRRLHVSWPGQSIRGIRQLLHLFL